MYAFVRDVFVCKTDCVSLYFIRVVCVPCCAPRVIGWLTRFALSYTSHPRHHQHSRVKRNRLSEEDRKALAARDS